MSTVERKEYQETKIMRTVSPVRNGRGSKQNLTQFDNNLDHLLEDLQNSVSRPGSSLGNGYSKETTTRSDFGNKTNSLSRISNVKPSNPVTEYSSDDAYSYTSPDGRKHVKSYKKESYAYKSSGGGGAGQSSINQLDTLLDDLQKVKNTSYSSDNIKESYNNNIGITPEFNKDSNASSKRTVQRELHYGDTPKTSSRTHTLERTEREGSLTRDIQYSSEGNYGDIRHIRPISPASSSRTSTLSKQTKVSNVHAYPLEVVETVSPDINPEILAHLDPNLHPPGNTKVTTTIKTYTYEIPGSGTYPTNLNGTSNSVLDSSTDKYVYSQSPNNQSQTTPSKSFVYNKLDKYAEENTVNYNNNYAPYQKPSPPDGHRIVKETVTTRNYQPNKYPNTTVQPDYQQPHLPNGNQQSYVYNETVTTRNVNNNNIDNYPRQPPPGPTYIVDERHHNTINNNTTTSRNYPYNTDGSYPPQHDKTVIYKHETHTTNNNNTYGGPTGGNKQPLNHYPPKPTNEPVNIHYKYKSESTTTNNYKSGGNGFRPTDETEPLIPKPFPVTDQIDEPPKRLDELMATIGHEPPNGPLNAGYNAHEQELAQKKKVETLKRQQTEADDMQKKEPVARSKNLSGPPVYYPPGHEMFAKKEEEGGGAWRAEGAYGKESGKYKYEAESKSKSKSRSGAAIVPVCLPLCCGLPCSIL